MNIFLAPTEYMAFKNEVNQVQETGMNKFDDEEKSPLCTLCGALRLSPRCRKPVDGLPTRPKICRICLVYLAVACF